MTNDSLAELTKLANIWAQPREVISGKKHHCWVLPNTPFLDTSQFQSRLTLKCAFCDHSHHIHLQLVLTCVTSVHFEIQMPSDQALFYLTSHPTPSNMMWMVRPFSLNLYCQHATTCHCTCLERCLKRQHTVGKKKKTILKKIVWVQYWCVHSECRTTDTFLHPYFNVVWNYGTYNTKNYKPALKMQNLK